MFSLVLLLLVTPCFCQDYLVDWKTKLEEVNTLSAVMDETHHAVPFDIGTSYFNITFTGVPQRQTVHNLRPHDIDVLGAMGDSVTAATGAGADYLPGIAIQFRGVSWLAGGDETLDSSMTLTNILRKFNPQIKGYSSGNGLFFNVRWPEDWFNVAVPGARAHDMSEQAWDIVSKMKRNDSRINFENSWKLISLWIGGNDLCALDRDPDGASPETYVDEIKKGLDILHENIPRAIVQVVQILEIYPLPELQKSPVAPPLCGIVQAAACGYVVNANETIMGSIKEKNWQYQDQLAALIDSGRYDTRDDFTVILQPFFEETVLPLDENGDPDVSFFSPDCFHFSSKGHAMGAMNTWNNMLEPYGEKSTEWSVRDLKCPTEDHPYIFTRKNSGSTPTLSRKRRKAASKHNEPSVVQCPEPCTRVADWAVGLLCGLAGASVLQVFVMVGLYLKK